MYQDCQIEFWEEEYVYSHVLVAHLRFWKRDLPRCHWVAEVAFLANVASVQVSSV